MGTKAREILKIDVQELIEMLNRAYASEWFAYYQYWIGAKMVKGPMKDAAAEEMFQHANEEFTHGDMLADRIIQLGGIPITSPQDWYNWSPCIYDPPSDPYVDVVLEQNIKGEQCAIQLYSDLIEKTKDKDQVTYDIAIRILEQEIEHEEELQAIREDLSLMLQHVK